MKAIFVAVTLCGMTVWTNAIAAQGCHFKSKFAIVCVSGHNAVDAFDIYGYDTNRITQSYSRYALSQAQCFLEPNTAKIQEFSHGRVAYINGWRGATEIAINNKDDGIVADEYLEGKCEKYVVPVIKYSMPELKQ